MQTLLLLIFCFLAPTACFAEDPAMTPEIALKRLLSGNERYAKDQLECPERLQERRQAVVAKQNPFAVIVGCSDSRVPAEIVFDQGVGDIFVVRVAGNVIGPSERDSIEFALEHLHASLVLVLGHENCGAVKAVLEGKDEDIPSVAALIEPAIKGSPNLEAAVKANVRSIVKQLKDSAFVRDGIAKKRVDVVGGYYNLNSGKVALLDN